ncbi:Crp/Fnr family transcriptional regulator [Shewanella rhizosphaerae]|nr:Crp/Fnr family transcriptional regulator [Shewanella rhizosphaerae]
MTTISDLASQGYELFCQLLKKRELKTKRFQPGDYLLKQGQEITELYWVSLGQYSIKHTVKNGRTLSLGLFFADNRLFGEVELLTATKCQFDVCASEMIEAKVIPTSLILELIQKEPKLAIWLSQSLSEKYQDTMAVVLNRILYPLGYNIALDIEQRYLDAKPKVNFAQVYKEAERFGCSERTYSRVVLQLVELGLVEKVNNQIKVKNIEKLSAFIKTLNE